jgi:polysaccharide biosynthesis transport protein
MAVDFRQRSAGEIGKIIKRKIWHILLPTIVGLVAVSWVVSKLPNIYESQSLLTVKAAVISNKVVSSLSDEDLTQRINTMNNIVLSRSSLEPMIAKYKLYDFEKSQGMPMELIIEKMKGKIKVETAPSIDEKVNAFTIRYQDKDPRSTQQVTAELASMYVNTQIDESFKQADTTREFLEKQVTESKTTLDLLEKQRLEIMSANRESLPDTSQGLIAQLTGLHQREDTISKEREGLMAQKGNYNQQIANLNSQSRLIQDFGEKDENAAISKNDYKKTQAYGELIKTQASLSAKLENLKKEYREKHPEVLKAQTEISEVNKKLADMAKDAVDIRDEATTAVRGKAEMRKKQFEIDRASIESSIRQIEQQISFKDNDLRQNATQIMAIETKLNSVPDVKVALEGINNQYQSAKTSYDDLLKKQADSKLQVEVAANAQGETIKVTDAASLPSSPVNLSKRYAIIGAGAAAGLLLGLILAGIFEIPKLFKIQNIEDAKHYTGLPVLASVPPLLTHQEISWNNRLHWLKVFAAIAAAVGSIPLIAMALQMSRILERLV